MCMEIKFQNSKATSVEFPHRNLRNKEERNWTDSKEQRVFLEKQDTCIDGSSGDILVKYKIPPYLKERIIKGEIIVNGVYFPNQTDPDIESLFDTQERMLLNGKTASEADPIELIQAGLL